MFYYPGRRQCSVQSHKSSWYFNEVLGRVHFNKQNAVFHNSGLGSVFNNWELKEPLRSLWRVWRGSEVLEVLGLELFGILSSILRFSDSGPSSLSHYIELFLVLTTFKLRLPMAQHWNTKIIITHSFLQILSQNLVWWCQWVILNVINESWWVIRSVFWKQRANGTWNGSEPRRICWLGCVKSVNPWLRGIFSLSQSRD